MNSIPNTNKSRVKSFLPYFIFTVVVIIGLLLVLFFKQNLGTAPDTPLMTRSVSPTNGVHFEYSLNDLTKKNKLIQSNNIDYVTEAIRLGHIPNDSVDSRSFSTIAIKAFKLDLSLNNRYQKLSSIINISEFSNTEEVTFTNNVWKGYGYSEASNMYTKDGYACIILEPNRFGSKPYISCANVLNLSQNSFTNVSTFMLNVASKAGIDCKSENCKIIEAQEEFPLNKYGRDLVYFDKNISRSNDEQLIVLINQEASSSADFLKSSGWSVTLQDYTETERKWNEQALISVLVSAENHYFICNHTITIMGIGKRQMVKCAYQNNALEEVQNFYNPYK